MRHNQQDLLLWNLQTKIPYLELLPLMELCLETGRWSKKFIIHMNTEWEISLVSLHVYDSDVQETAVNILS